MRFHSILLAQFSASLSWNLSYDEIFMHRYKLGANIIEVNEAKTSPILANAGRPRRFPLGPPSASSPHTLDLTHIPKKVHALA